MTKTKSIIIVCLAIFIAVFSGCSTQANNSKPELQTNTTVTSTDEETTKSAKATEKEMTISEGTTQKNEVSDTTTTRPADQKSAGQSTTKKSTTTQKQTNDKKQTAAQSQTTTQKATTTKKQNVTQKQTTTKKVTTTVTTTAKQKKLTKSDVDWVQSQAHAYIKSKGMSVNSSVSSFSYRTSSYNYTNKNELLSDIKNTIDYEYSECINSGWKKVDMYVSVSADGDGDYWLVVMYG